MVGWEELELICMAGGGAENYKWFFEWLYGVKIGKLFMGVEECITLKTTRFP